MDSRKIGYTQILIQDIAANEFGQSDCSLNPKSCLLELILAQIECRQFIEHTSLSFAVIYLLKNGQRLVKIIMGLRPLGEGKIDYAEITECDALALPVLYFPPQIERLIKIVDRFCSISQIFISSANVAQSARFPPP